ncbi:hypothetical protein DY000_02022783 [Brassica cretica]|uniref:Uncharacterized protein n=1 Tax=Brassica cretica TaxID=69181 RepID=A0ABQ7EL81_BRACR|nr:hypothetical protein DY000_02022783 [Brassica cretica]
MEDHPHDESFDLQEIHSRVKELEYRHRNCRDESGESIPCGFEALAQDYALQLETKVKEIVEDYCHVDSMDVEESEAYLEYLRKELHSAEAESAKVSQEIERLSKAHAEGLLLHFVYAIFLYNMSLLDCTSLESDLEGLLFSLDFLSSQDVDKSKDNLPSSSSMEVCDVDYDEKFKMFELENQIEEKRVVLKSLEDLDSVRKRLDAAEQVEDAFTGLKVLKFDENFITLQLRTCIPKLDGLLGQHDLVHTTEPSELIHELLIHLKDKTTEITKVEMLPNDVYIGDIIDAADSLRQIRLHSALLDTRSSLQGLVAKVTERIISATLRKCMVKSSKTIRGDDLGGDSSRRDDVGGDSSTETTWEEVRRRDNGHEGDAPSRGDDLGGDSLRRDDVGGDSSTETTWEEVRRRDNGHEGDAPLRAKSPFRSPLERIRERREMSI